MKRQTRRRYDLFSFANAEQEAIRFIEAQTSDKFRVLSDNDNRDFHTIYLAQFDHLDQKMWPSLFSYKCKTLCFPCFSKVGISTVKVAREHAEHCWGHRAAPHMIDCPIGDICTVISECVGREPCSDYPLD